jgi:hypothetical protein
MPDMALSAILGEEWLAQLEHLICFKLLHTLERAALFV